MQLNVAENYRDKAVTMLATFLGASVTVGAASGGVRRALVAGANTLHELPAIVAALAPADAVKAALLGANAAVQGRVAEWYQWAESVGESGASAKDAEAVEARLQSSSYVAGNSMTVADALVAYLVQPAVAGKSFPAIARWLDQVSHEGGATLAAFAPAGFSRAGATASASTAAAAAAPAAAEGGAEKKEKPAKEKKASAPAPKKEEEAPIESDPIAACDLRVGIIVKAWEHPESDKLWCEEIDLGEPEGPRQIGSGLRAHFTQEQMTGQRVVVFANLQPRKLAGFPSNGMVLCATAEDGSVEFVVPPADAKVGERVTFPGHENRNVTPNQLAKKKIFELVAGDLKVDDKLNATWQGVPFMTSAGPCTVKSAKNGPIK
jgi:aminoacyl tRNA synthase complex-interacting multifunctional protein 1